MLLAQTRHSFGTPQPGKEKEHQGRTAHLLHNYFRGHGVARLVTQKAGSCRCLSAKNEQGVTDTAQVRVKGFRVAGWREAREDRPDACKRQRLCYIYSYTTSNVLTVPPMRSSNRFCSSGPAWVRQSDFQTFLFTMRYV